MSTPKLQEAVADGKVFPSVAPSGGGIVHFTLEVRVNRIDMA